jgi:hypothetical protein
MKCDLGGWLAKEERKEESVTVSTRALRGLVLLSFCCCDKILEQIDLKEKIFILAHGLLASLLCACGEAEHHGDRRACMMEQSCSPHGSMEC